MRENTNWIHASLAIADEACKIMEKHDIEISEINKVLTEAKEIILQQAKVKAI